MYLLFPLKDMVHVKAEVRPRQVPVSRQHQEDVAVVRYGDGRHHEASVRENLTPSIGQLHAGLRDCDCNHNRPLRQIASGGQGRRAAQTQEWNASCATISSITWFALAF